MGSDWPEHRLDEVTELIVDCPHSTPEWTDSGVIVLRNQYIRNGRLDLSDPSYTTEDGYASRIKRAVPTAGDLVLTREAPMGEVCQIPEGVKCCLGQRMVLIRADKSLVNPKYLLFVIQSPYLQHQISWNEGTGTTVSNIRLPNLRAFKIPTPELETQKAIAHVLGTLDDKIELNRQMNATLEAMAQALFKSWFVDFDPVIDNALAAGNPIPEPLQARAQTRTALGDRRKPLPAAIQQQFPSRFVFNDDLGWLPEGWEGRSIGDVFNLLGGHAFKSGDYVDDGQYGIVTIKNVQDAFFVEKCTNRITLIPQKMKPYCYLSAGDILLSLTGNVGRVCIVSPGNYLLNQRVVKLVGSADIGGAFTYFFFRQRSLYEDMLTIAKGTAQQNLSPIETAKILRALPSNTIIESMQNELEAPFQKIVSNTAEIQSLSSIRDTLLPKLLSGQLRIPAAEKLIESVQ